MSQATLDRPVGGTESLLAPDLLAPPVAVAGRHVDLAAAERNLARGDVSHVQREFRHWFGRTLAASFVRPWFRIEVEGLERVPDGPAVYCFNHLSWMDPMLMLASFPDRPRMYFYGPKETPADMRRGKNRIIWWSGLTIPFSPNKNDLRKTLGHVQAVFDTGGVLAISGEGRIHVHEGDLLPFQEGVSYLAIRSGVPIVPVAITGVSWARFRSRIVIRVGEPIHTSGRPNRQTVAHYTARTWHALRAMVEHDRDREPPGRFVRWLTDLFNDWGPGGRAAATQLRGPDPATVPVPALDDA